MSPSFTRKMGSSLAGFLSKPLSGYQRLDTVSVGALAEVLQPGDVVLVEGNTRISVAVQYLSQSSWSHACLYVGNTGDPGSEASLLEADLRDGVRLVALDHYREFNLRICRPLNLSAEDQASLVENGRKRLGHKYDLKNVIDLVRYLIQKPAVPQRFRRSMISLGSGEPTKAICSTLIAELFQSIDYPILPILGPESAEGGKVPVYYRRHFTHFTPRDFDLSPYFQVIKPTLESGFDYKDINWRNQTDSNDAEE